MVEDHLQKRSNDRVMIAGDDMHTRGGCAVINALSPGAKAEFCNKLYTVTYDLADEAGRAFNNGDINQGWEIGNSARALYNLGSCCRFDHRRPRSRYARNGNGG